MFDESSVAVTVKEYELLVSKFGSAVNETTPVDALTESKAASVPPIAKLAIVPPSLASAVIV